ncbi:MULTISPECIES: YqfO family protein [unclassified Neptuniibacter]|uniref:Nif3-like dinuclear metal center hexameric protein n=1 Tax=unclassified Neptuniibacter TaxID=2630693 RepID=UPI0026E47A64|nr:MULTISPECIES: YqfO family protein [unclassified Neptuniibacter]MDO6513775.1 YqfO family protein [Neptuniibacter sp. 2_MG-2023]MDO6593264.1 YqfO family protein [Neptuniibacter sp. 1_MG-2023]
MYKLSFFVPEDHLESVKSAIFTTGAGRIGNYDQCCWQVLGRGQFRALEGSTPFIGKYNELETVSEWKVELVCDDEFIKQAVMALKQAHPYEEPAYEVWKLETF